MKKPYFRFLYLVFAVLVLASLQFFPWIYDGSFYNAQSFQKVLHAKERLATEGLRTLKNNADFTTESLDAYSRYTDQEIYFYVFEKDNPIFWTNSSVPISVDNIPNSNSIIKLKNGWFEVLTEIEKGLTYVGLILIKHEHELENKYLTGAFQKDFNLPIGYQLSVQQTEGNNIISSSQKYLFSISPPGQPHTSSNWLSIVLFLLAFISLVKFFYEQLGRVAITRKYRAYITMLFIVVCYFGTTFLNHPSALYSQKIFSPTIFAQSSILPSLGSLIFASLCLFSIILLLGKAISQQRKTLIAALTNIATSLFIVSIIASWFQGLINNSSILFDVSSVSSISTYSIIGVILILTLNIGIVTLVSAIFNHYQEAINKKTLILLFVVAIAIFSITSTLFLSINFVLIIWITPLIFLIGFGFLEKNKFYAAIITLVLISLVSSYGFIKYSSQKSELNNFSTLKKLAREQDPIAEFLFEEKRKSIESDSTITLSIDNYWSIKDSIDGYIIDNYFGGFWEKFDVQTYICQNEDSLLIEDDANPVSCFYFFSNKVQKESNQLFNSNKNFSFLYNDEGLSGYLGNIKISKTASLFIELTPKLLSNVGGYPELLLNTKDIDVLLDVSQFSFAKYKKKALTTHIGIDEFPSKFKLSEKPNELGYSKVSNGNKTQLIYESDKYTVVILSYKGKTWTNFLTTFSYFFILTGLLCVLIGAICKISPFDWKLAITDFSTKIQLFVIVFTLFSFVILGWGTSYFLKQQHQENTVKALQEKIQSVLIELQDVIGEEDELKGEVLRYLDYHLIELSNIFYSDINLYNLNGKLLSTSRPEMIEKGLITEMMNPKAVSELITNGKSSWITDEKISSLNYLSAYMPIRNYNNNIIAYLNLPYFAKQNQLENELSSFFTTLINVFAFLFLLSIIIAIIFAKYISKPVTLIKDKMANLQIGQYNELIEWNSNDEIGALVKEYNNKILELQKSASLLAKSERENAWREMAKQVAHEIKNPLTPMKLSIQHLQRTINDNPEDAKERIERTSKTLIEQIDTLTNIANEFSSFAKMPQSNEQKIELLDVISSVIDLYQNDKTTIDYNCWIEQCEVLADKDQMNRVFNNLIKNAIQAIPDTKEGKIIVSVSEEDSMYLVSIEDNGIGIEDEKKDKIFQPNFTTKTTGMGLGLAMVKNIIENASGTISFNSQLGEGTTFLISLPKS